MDDNHNIMNYMCGFAECPELVTKEAFIRLEKVILRKAREELGIECDKAVILSLFRLTGDEKGDLE